MISCEWWIFVIISAVTLVLYALLLLSLYIMLSRKIGSSDTSSDTSEDSADSPSCPQGQGSGENISYTSLVFPGKGRGPGCAQDYKDIKSGMDYVNVDPKKKEHLWPCFSPMASKPVEYTEVKL
ncbi:hypothetical protein BTVI_130931 [Pitangus sulphuratus]|nr:hypothetical protein BTVI_130931 [Pitangus sulphuratus]